MINIYTDGACSGNPGPGGWGMCVTQDNEQIFEDSGFYTQTTNNRMELTALLQALDFSYDILLDDPTIVSINIFSDSKYVVDAITKGWLDKWNRNGYKKADKTEVLNQDLWIPIHSMLNSTYDLPESPLKNFVNIRWIKGHDGHLGNEHADTIACNARDEAKKMLALTQIDKEASDGN